MSAGQVSDAPTSNDSPSYLPVPTSAAPHAAAIERLQADLWLLWRAVSRRVAGTVNADTVEQGRPQFLGRSLTMNAASLVKSQDDIAALLEAHRALSNLVFPATPESIQLSEAFIGMREADSDDGAWARRRAMSMRIIFASLTLLAAVALVAMVGFAFEAVLGQALVNETSAAVTEQSTLRRQLVDPQRRSPSVDTELGNQLSRGDARIRSANARLKEWSGFVGKILVIPASVANGSAQSATPSDVTDQSVEANLATAKALLSIITMFLIPLLAGFLGIYCNFAQWFIQRLNALALAPSDRIAVVVRLALGTVATTLTAALFVIVNSDWLSHIWFFVPAFLFICGYVAPRFFSWLDDFVNTSPALILVSRLAESTRKIVEKAQKEQISKFEGTVKQAIGQTLGVPTLVNFTGKVGFAFSDQSGESVLAEKKPGEHSALLAFDGIYRFEVAIGQDLPEMKVVESLELRAASEQATPAAKASAAAPGAPQSTEQTTGAEFEVEVEALHLVGGSRVATGPLDPQKPWKHIFELSAQSFSHADVGTDRKADTLWLSVRQSGITCYTIDIQIYFGSAMEGAST